MNKYMNILDNTISIKQPLSISGVNTPINVNQNLDAFQRLRVSLPATQYEYNFQYNKAPLIWDELITGTGVATHQPALSSVRMTTGMVRTNAQVKLVGYGDGSNGIFFGQDDTGVFVLLRSSVSGVVSDARKVYQANWNMDKFDGTGLSKVILDITKTQIFITDIQWLGVGRVRCGLEYNGMLYWIHEFYNTNLLTTVYTTTMNLPMRYEILDTGNSIIRQTFQYMRYRPGKSLQVILTFNMYDKTINTLDQICSTVITETSNDLESYYQSSVNMGSTAKTITTTRNAVITIRPKATFNSIVNRGQIVYEEIDLLLVGTGTVIWQLVYNTTLGGSPSWISGGANAIFEYDTAGTTCTGGEVIASGYAVSTATNKAKITSEIGAKYPVSLNISGLNPKNLTLACVATTGSVDVFGTMTARSYY